MKNLILVLSLFVSGLSFGVAQTSKVPTDAAAYSLNRNLGPAGLKYSAGTVLKEAHNTAVGVWSYALTGGAAGDHAVGITLPNKAVIRKVFYDVVTAPVGSGATIAFKAVSAGDLKTATAVGSWSNRVDGALDGAVANFIKLSAQKTVYATIASGLTAGKIKVFVDYVVSE